MRIFYGGAESPTLRKRLVKAEASRFAVSFWHLRDRLPRDGSFPLTERFPAGSEILLDAGAYTANKRREDHDDEWWDQYLEDYASLIVDNIGALTLVTEFDFLGYNIDEVWSLRYEVWDAVPAEKFLPVWHTEHGYDELNKLASIYPRVAIPSKELATVAQRLPPLAARYGCRFHGLAVNSADLAVKARLSSLSSTGWTAVSRYGERVVFEGGHLHRYGKESKEEFLRRHRTTLEREEFDLELLEDEDATELSRLAVVAYDRWAEHATRKIEGVDTPEAELEPRNQEPALQEPDTSSYGGRNSGSLRTPDEMRLLPIIHEAEGVQRTTDEDGHVHDVRTERQLVSRPTSIRRCDDCYIAKLCPEYKEGSSCAFAIPVEIRTKEQLVGVMTALLEMQGQRALFARFAEELEGGYPTNATSKELDRFFRLVASMKDIQDSREFLRVSVDAKSEAGVLSRIFGDVGGERMRELQQDVDPQAAERVLEAAVTMVEPEQE